MAMIANMLRPEGDPKIIETGPSSLTAEDRLAKSLGWFSIGLGLTELFAARRLTRALGMEGNETLFRAFGAREFASGMTTLSTEKETGLWSRVAGDAMDLMALSRGLSPYNPRRGNVKLAMLGVAGITVVDALTAWSVTARKQRSTKPRTFEDRSGFPKGLQHARRSLETKYATAR